METSTEIGSTGGEAARNAPVFLGSEVYLVRSLADVSEDKLTPCILLKEVVQGLCAVHVLAYPLGSVSGSCELICATDG